MRRNQVPAGSYFRRINKQHCDSQGESRLGEGTMGLRNPHLSLNLSELVMLFASMGLVAVVAFGFLI